MAKVDKGHEETEKVLKALEKRISKEYAQAEKEIKTKLDDYMKRFATKDKIKAQAVLDGKITQEEYDKWRIGQIMIGKRWEEMKTSVAEDLANTAQIAKSIAYNTMPDVYAINHNYATFQVEQVSKVDTSYTLYNRDAVARLYNDKTKHWHDYGKKTAEKIAMGKQVAWDKKQVQSVMQQSILQGESIGKIATRLATTVGESDRKVAIRNARTMTTGVQNAGRVDAYERAESMGIQLEQQWLATIDDRTRHEHRILDGQKVPVGEKFQVEGYEIAYPADPEAEGFLVYNCRCTLVPVLKGFDRDMSMRQNRSIEDDYDAWKESHYSYSEPITKQDDIAQTMKNSYVQDYQYLAGQNPNIPPSDDKSDIARETKDEAQHTNHKEDYNSLMQDMKDYKVEHLVVSELTKPLTEDEIIKKLAGGDETGGSCASLAVAYCANKMGYDITDFRGGGSQEVFSSDWKKILSVADANIIEYSLKKQASDTAKMLMNIEENKEYILVVGRHEAIVRRTAERGLEYLELQSKNSNGWKPFEKEVNTTLGKVKKTVTDTLVNRFKARKTVDRFRGKIYEKKTYLVDVNSLKKNEEFKNALGYMNTKPDKQKKGNKGHEK